MVLGSEQHPWFLKLHRGPSPLAFGACKHLAMAKSVVCVLCLETWHLWLEVLVCLGCGARYCGYGMQVKAREETLARDAERHQQLKEESKKQVSCPTYSAAVHRHFTNSPSACSCSHHVLKFSMHFRHGYQLTVDMHSMLSMHVSRDCVSQPTAVQVEVFSLLV